MELDKSSKQAGRQAGSQSVSQSISLVSNTTVAAVAVNFRFIFVEM